MAEPYIARPCRVLKTRDLIFYGMVVITPIAPVPIYGVTQQVARTPDRFAPARSITTMFTAFATADAMARRPPRSAKSREATRAPAGSVQRAMRRSVLITSTRGASQLRGSVAPGRGSASRFANCN